MTSDTRPRRSRWWRLASGVTTTCGVLAVLTGTVLYALGAPGRVDPRDLARVYDPAPVDAGLVAVVGAVALGLVAAAGLPRHRLSSEAIGSAVGQAMAAVAALVGTAFGSRIGNIWIYGPDDKCVYASCWPAGAQAAIAAVPGLLAAGALFVGALLVSRKRWLVRATVPAGVWLGAVLLARLTWNPWLLPILQGSPP